MEDQNQNNTNQPVQPETQNQPIAQQPVQPAQPVQPNQPVQPAQQPVQPNQQALPKAKRKIPKNLIFGGIGAFVVILLLLVSFMMLGGLPIDNIIPTQPIEESPTPSPTPVVQSPYADDEDVLEIKSDIEEFDKSLNSTNLREETLRVPSLEWEINFE